MASGDTSSIDAVLESAVARGDVGGIVAIAATRDGTIYQGAFGKPFRDSDENICMDSVFRIASMTKAVTSVAAMQLVEQGLLGLDTPVAEYIPSFADLQVLEGFDEANGQPRLRTPAAPPTVRQLLSHTAGFGYEIWNPMLQQAVARGAAQSLFAPDDQYLQAPLVFDPGTEWQYGINTDWLGRLVEILRDASLEQVFSDQICEPLGMNDTHFSLPNEKVSRLVAQNDRQADGVLVERPRESPPRISAFRGGDGLYSTAPDYACFLQALLNGGEHNGARILSDQTVAVMGQNQIGNVEVGASYSVDKELSNDFELFPGSVNRFGLGFLINGKPVASGRAAGSLTWAGIHNTYFWIDPSSEVCAVLMTQILPFFDDKVLAILDAFELEIYAGR